MLAKAKAKLLLEKYCIDSPGELDLEKIANAEGIIIEEGNLTGHLGRISRSKNSGLIKISSMIKEEGQKRFVTAHELGHFFNEKNKPGNLQLASCSIKELMTYKPEQSKENEANRFAAELLMPEEWFINSTKKKRLEKGLLQDIAQYFNVSLTAAALRYSETGPHPCALIFSSNGKVEWSSINKYFPFKWVPKGYEVNDFSHAYEFFHSPVQNGEKDTTGLNTEINEVLANAWFLKDNNYKKDYFMYEQNIFMKNYNSVLTLLWGE